MHMHKARPQPQQPCFQTESPKEGNNNRTNGVHKATPAGRPMGGVRTHAAKGAQVGIRRVITRKRFRDSQRASSV
jgi:hypothetical protein